MKKLAIVVIFGVIFFGLSIINAFTGEYPYKNVCPKGGNVFGTERSNGDYWVDIWNFAQCNCMSYVAWKLNQFANNEDATDPAFDNSYQLRRWSHAYKWRSLVDESFAHFSKTPEFLASSDKAYPWKKYGNGRVFDIRAPVAWWNAVPNTAMEYGHVAFVDKINWKSNGEVESIKVSEYNFSEKGKPGSRPLYPNTKDYPDGFLYIVTDEFLECDLTDLCQPKKKSTSTTGAGMGGSVSGSAPSASSKKAVVFIKQLYIEGYKIRFFPEEKEKVCAVVGNNGKEPKNDVKVIFERSKGTKIDPKPKEIGKENIKHGNIKKGATKTECTSFTVPNDPGEKYNIRACAKFDGSTSCSNPLVYEIKERPKLSIEYFYLLNEDGGLKATFSSGENLLASAGIKNSGGDVEEDVKVGFEILNSSRKVIASGTENIRDYNLEKGEKKKESHIFTVPAPGNYTAKVCADPSNKVQEDNEKDNCKETSFRAVSP